MRNFQICTKSHQDLPKMHKIPCEIQKRPKISQRTSKNAQNPMRNFLKCTKSHEKLPNMHGRSWWDFVHIWKFLMGFCAF
jgi:hypothetical protein